MSPLKRFVEEDSIAVFAKPISQLNIFNGSSPESLFVKTVDLLERGAPNCSAACPESRSLRIAILMHEMMQKISILRNHPLRARVGVIRAENRGDVGLLLKYFCNTPKPSRGEHYICVYEEKNFSTCYFSTAIARIGWTP